MFKNNNLIVVAGSAKQCEAQINLNHETVEVGGILQLLFRCL
jgi:hypothetical protein